MKKKFFAKVGHFAVVGALLFNSFGVGFVSAGPLPPSDIVVEKYNIFELYETTPETAVNFFKITNHTTTTMYINFTINNAVEIGTDYAYGSIPNFVDDNGITVFSVSGGEVANFKLNILNDTILEDNENITVTLNSAYYNDGSQTPVSAFVGPISNSATIIDNDLPNPVFSRSSNVLWEGSANQQEMVTLTNTTEKDLYYTLAFNPETDTAVLETDYALSVVDFTGVETPINDNLEIFVPKNSASSFKYTTTGNNPTGDSYDNSFQDGTRKATITIFQVRDVNNNTFVLPEPNAFFEITIWDDESNIGFSSAASTVNDNTLVSSTSGLGASIMNRGDLDVLINFELLNTGTAVYGTTNDYSLLETDTNLVPDGTGNTLLFVQKNSSVSIPLSIHDLNGNKTVDLKINSITTGLESVIPFTGSLLSHTITLVDTGTGNPINHAPTVNTALAPTDQTISVNGSIDVNATTLFSDEDGDVLTYSFLPTGDSHIQVSTNIDTHYVFSIKGLIPGVVNMTFNATDSHGEVVSTSFVLTIVNHAPTVNIANAPQDQTISVNGSVVVNATTLFSDEDGDVLQYAFESDNSSIVHVTANIDSNYVFTITGIEPGVSNIKIKATDPQGEFVYAPFTLTIVNHAPTVQTALAPTDQTISINDTMYINASTLFSDEDGDVLTYSFLPIGDSHIQISTNIDTHYVFSVKGLVAGVVNMTFNATDSHGEVVSTSFVLTIDENHAPTLSTTTVFVDNVVSLQETSGANLHLYFEDVDAGDTLTFSATTTDASIVTSGIDAGGQLTLTPHNYGTVQVTVTATDSHGARISDTFSLTVNTPPELTANILVNKEIDLAVTSTLVIEAQTIRNAFTDQNGDTLTFGTASSNTAVATASMLGGNAEPKLTLIGLTVGTSTITVSAEDNIDTTTTTFLLTVIDSSSEEETGNGEETENNGGNTGSSGGSNGGGGTFIANTPPTAAFTAGQEVTIEVNKEVTFDASASTDANGNIQFYFWNFGDGSAEEYYTLPTVGHTYTAIGTYTLAVKVRDSHGAENTAQVTVHVVKGNGSTPATETEQTGTPSSDTQTETTPETGDTTEETTIPTTPSTEEPTTPDTRTETTAPTGETNGETTDNTNTEQGTTPTEEEVETPTTEEQALPTWIRIIFGSSAVAAIAGAGIAINRARRVI